MINDQVLNLLPALVLACAAGMVGVFALLRRMSLAADAMSHIALPGLGLALLYGINPVLGGASTLLAGAVLIWSLERKTQIPTETIIGVIFSVSLALGSLLTPEEDIIEALFGGFGEFTVGTFVTTAFLSLCIIAALWWLKNKFVILMISKDLARVSGLPGDRLDLAFIFIFALTIILGLKFLGALLMGSLIIIPAATAKNLGWNINSMLVISSFAALLSVFGGYIVAENFSLDLGPTIVSLASAVFLGSLFVRRA